MFVDDNSRSRGAWLTHPTSAIQLIMDGNKIPQQTVLMNVDTVKLVRGVNENYHHIMDYDLWIRMSGYGQLLYIPGIHACFRLHSVSKSLSQSTKFWLETQNMLTQLGKKGKILTIDQQAEAIRRVHIRSSLEFIFPGNDLLTIEHLNTAFQDRIWPWGNVERLAEIIAWSPGICGISLFEDPSKLQEFTSLLDMVENHYMGRKLRMKLQRLYYSQKIFECYQNGDSKGVRHYLIRAIPRNIGLVRNRGVLSIIWKSVRSIFIH